MPVPLADICAHIRATLPDYTPASVAAHFALSRFHLSRRFHRETGLPLCDYSHPPKVSDKARRRRQYAFVRRGFP